MRGSDLGKVKKEPWKLFFLRNFKKIVFTAELSRAVVLKLNQHHLGGSLKHRLSGPSLRFKVSRSEMGPKDLNF